jgi:phage terminase small subunit
MENQQNPPKKEQIPEEIVQLSPKRERFCQEYLKNHNATEAAKNAGYSKNSAYTQGPRLLENAEIRARIAQLEKPIADRLHLDTEWVLRHSKEIVERCMQHVAVMVFDHDKKEMVQDTDEEGKDIWLFDPKGANQALALIAKHVGGFVDRVDHTTKGKEINQPPVFQIIDSKTKDMCEQLIAGGGRESQTPDATPSPDGK